MTRDTPDLELCQIKGPDTRGEARTGGRFCAVKAVTTVIIHENCGLWYCSLTGVSST